MKLFLAYLIPFILFILGIRNNKSKLITYLFLLYFWVLMGLNTNTPDYNTYEMYFLNPSSFNVEWGFGLLCDLLRNAGFTYLQFRMLYAAIYSSLAVLTAKRLSTNENYVLAMFLLWPFVPFVSGIRFALAAMIVCFGIPFLLPGHKRGTIKYILCVVIASLIHTSALFYLVFIFAKRRYKSFQYFLIAFTVVIGGILIKTSLLMNIVQNYYPNPHLIKWLSLTSTDIGHLNLTGLIVHVFFVIAFPVLVSILTKFITGSKKNSFIEDVSSTEEKAYQRLILYKNISIYGLLAIPSYFISSEFERLLFGMLMVYYSTFAEFKYSQIKIYAREKMIYRIACMLLVVLLLALYIYSTKSHDVFATFRDNLLFQ